MKKAVLLILAALMIPTSVALAKPPHPPKPAPMVMYVLKGTLSNYAAYDSVTPANGTITILVKHGNKAAHSLKGMTLTFPVDANTKITLRNGVTAIVNGDRGIVKIKAAKAAKHTSAADLATALQAVAAKQIVDQGAPKP
jgi:hypothetical protein